MNEAGWIILGIVNIPVYIGLGWVIFDNWDNFWEAIRYRLTPDIISLFRGEFFDDWYAEWKLGLWFGACISCVIAEGWLITSLFL